MDGVGWRGVVGIGVVALAGTAAVSMLLWPRPHPNVLLISIDSLRADHLHCYGYPRETSPAIDALASQGVRFQTVVSPSPWTLPAHVTLLTALPPVRHGVVDHDRTIAPDTVLLAEVLHGAGYATAGFAGGPYLHSSFGFGRGFEHYDDETVIEKPDYEIQKTATSRESLRITADWLEAWQRTRPDRPFFIFLHLWDVHYDYMPTPPYDTLFDPDYTGSISGFHFTDSPAVHPGMDPRDLAHIVALYDGEIRLTDEYVGRLVELLRTMRVLDDTIIVITSDHGDEFFEHGQKAHRNNLYDETILVPLVIRYPQRVPAGRVVPGQVRLMDVAPTVLALAGVPQPPTFGAGPPGVAAARDLSPSWLPDAVPSDVPAFSELHGRWRSMRTESAKLIRYVGSEPLWRDEEVWRRATQAPPPQREQFFDLATDPAERLTLNGTQPELRSRLESGLEAWHENWTRRDAVTTPARLDPAVQEQLRRLGYM
jgi:arylsulfatase A-like enzyme